MFDKIKGFFKKALCPSKVKMLMLMMVIGSAAAFAQNSAGD